MIRFQYPNESDWDAMMRRRRERLALMESDIDFRLHEVDMKIRLMNAYSGFQKYNRYQLEVYDNEGNTYDIKENGVFALSNKS